MLLRVWEAEGMAISYRQNINYAKTKSDVPATPRYFGSPDSTYDDARQAVVFVRVQKFLQRSGMRKGRFGKEVLGDPHMVRKMYEGARWRNTTMDKIEQWLDENEIGDHG
jgi:hypothetical protein